VGVNLLQILLVLVVVAAVGAVAAGVVRGGLDPADPTVPQSPLPADPITLGDVRDVRFSLALRGYRMNEVDAVLDRLVEELAARDAELAEREAEVAALRARRPAPRTVGD
jgi:DivIVA domain-containing protein